jgi:anti-sigma regulatory factor (Ser/Thr protein kinase)
MNTYRKSNLIGCRSKGCRELRASFVEAIDRVLLPSFQVPTSASVAITSLLLVVVTFFLRYDEGISTGNVPALTYFLVPVVVGSALLGIRGGYVTSLLSLILARLLLFSDYSIQLRHIGTDAWINYVGLMISTFIVATITGRLHSSLRQVKRSSAKLIETEKRRQAFHRDVMQAVTAGRLMLCDESEIQAIVSGDPVISFRLTEPSDIAILRERLRALCADVQLPERRTDDLCLCASEAASNAVKHAAGGKCSVWVSREEISVLIEDWGSGIAASELARATLELGYSTTVSLGMGFHLMLDTADLLALSTSNSGTKVLVQVRAVSYKSLAESLMDRFA